MNTDREIAALSSVSGNGATNRPTENALWSEHETLQTFESFYVVRLLLIGAAYFTLAFLGLKVASINPSATPVWAPTGVAIAAVLLWGYRVAPAILVAAFLVNQITAGSIWTSTAIAVGNTFEAVTAGYLVSYWAGGTRAFDTPIGIAKFSLIVIGASAISATVGIVSLTLSSYAEMSSFISIWLTWWFGDVTGALVVAPAVVLWAKSEPASLTPHEIYKTALVYIAAVVVGLICFNPRLQPSAISDALTFLVILPLLWAAVRRDPRDTATVVLIIAAFAIWGTMLLGGPFGKQGLNSSFILLLSFMLSIAIPSLALSAEVAARRRIEKEQRQRALETEVLWQASLQVASEGSFDDLLRTCLERICRVTGWPVGHVYFPDQVDNPNCLLSSSVWYCEHKRFARIADEIAGTVIKHGDGLPGRIWASGTPQWTEDLSVEAGPRQNIFVKYALRTAFGFPLYSGQKLQAVLEFFSTVRRPLDSHLLYIVQSIGEQLGRVLERQQAQERREILETTLGALSSAVYITDENQHILYMNAAAERQLSQSKTICIDKNRLNPIDRKARLAFAEILRRISTQKVEVITKGFTIPFPEPGNTGLIAVILPLARSQFRNLCGAVTATAAVFVHEAAAMSSSIGDAFAKLYGLTQSELRVLLAMARGNCVKQTANDLGICESTAKTHLKHIYAKTGTSRQSELIHLFISSIPPVDM